MDGRLASSDLELPLADFLDAVASEEPAPGGGSVAAIAGALAAALVEMSARFSHEWADGPKIVARAKELRERLAGLAPRDAAAYEGFLAARRQGGDMREALSAASDIPLRIAEAAVEVAELATLVAERGNPNLRSDASTGALIAGGAARAAASLVEVNLGRADDPRARRARELGEAAARLSSESPVAGVH
jgi:formiminotetrahydrofolate cyclodeaminase